MDTALYEPKLRRAKRRLSLRRFLLGRTHRRTGDAYFEAGTLYRLTGNLDAAAKCLSMAEQIHRARLGPGHPALALDLFSIAEYQTLWGERQRALQSYERARAILEANIRKDPTARHPHPDGLPLRQHLALLLANLAALHLELEQAGKARTCAEHALRLFVAEQGAASDQAVRTARQLVGLGVDPLISVREHAGESAAAALRDAYRLTHATDPVPEPIS